MTHPCARYDEAGIVEKKHDIWRNDDTCSYCGSLHPRRVFRLVARCQEVIEPSDPVGPYLIGYMRRKVYLQHFSKDERELFRDMLKTKSETERAGLLLAYTLLNQPKVADGQSV